MNQMNARLSDMAGVFHEQTKHQNCTYDMIFRFFEGSKTAPITNSWN